MSTKPPPYPTLQAFITQLMPIAAQFGVTNILIAARDPATKEIGIFGSVESMNDLRDAVEAKFVEKCGLVGETSWEA